MAYDYLTKDGLLFAFKQIKQDLQPKETGKGLSTNDFTDSYKGQVEANTEARHTHDNKAVIDGITADNITNWNSAQPNVIESIKVNGVAQTPTAKAVDISVPTKVSELTNDSAFVTKDTDITGNANTATKATQDSEGNVIKDTYARIASPTFTGAPKAPTPTAGNNSTQIATTAFVTKAVATAIAGVTSISYQIVESLPATGEAGVIYLVSNSGSSPNVYDEYIYVNSAFEKIGTTEVDLSGYVKKTDLVAITNSEISELWASA